MAHNIGEMFYVGAVPWHKLGTHCPDPLTLDDAIEKGGLDFSVSMLPLSLQDEAQSCVPQRMAVVRDDRDPGQQGRVLGVVHPKFKPLQNRDGAAIFDELFSKGAPVYQTGGYLKQGEVVWLQARLPDPIILADGDQLDTFLLYSNSHDGTLPIDVRFCTVRVVCNNTLNMALREGGQGRVFRRGHGFGRKRVKDDASRFFEAVTATKIEAQSMFNLLARVKCAEPEFARFLEKLLPIPASPQPMTASPSVVRASHTRRDNIEAARKQVSNIHMNGYQGPFPTGIFHPPAPSTWWGALNSVTAWVDHIQQINGDRFGHVMFGAGDDLKTRAFAAAVAAAKGVE